MWDCIKDIIDVLSKLAQTGFAGVGAYLAWKTFLKEEAQESEVVDLDSPLLTTAAELKIFETSNQTTTLKRTASGIECHLDDRRVGKRKGNRWTLSPDMVKKILEDGDIYVNQGFKVKTGYLSIGNHTNWLYSKKLFPEPANLHHRVVDLLRSASA
jgi:hypothetical protein